MNNAAGFHKNKSQKLYSKYILHRQRLKGFTFLCELSQIIEMNTCFHLWYDTETPPIYCTHQRSEMLGYIIASAMGPAVFIYSDRFLHKLREPFY